MKTFFSLILLMLVLASAPSFAQGFFTAKDGYQTAVDEVSNYIDNPELVMIGTRNMTDPESEMEMRYNTTNGTANAWVYMFRDTELTDLYYGVYVINPFVMVGFAIAPEDLELDFPMLEDSAFVNVNWLDSDDANVELLKCTDYAEFLANNPEPDELEIAMFYNPSFESLPMNEPFWSLKVTDGSTNISTSVNPYTLDKVCEKYTSVENIISLAKNIEIKQVGNNIRVASSNNISEEMTISVYSIDGSILFEQTFSNVSGELNVYIPFDSFSTGSFYITARAKNAFGIQPVVLVR